jgi:uncharacterized membrane protein SpoIIM required for sporulation
MKDLEAFLRQRRPDWQKLEVLLEQVEGNGLPSLDDGQAVTFARLYRRAASDLNQAQTFVSGDATVQYLNALVARCYLVIHAGGRVSFLGFVRTLVLGYPALFRQCLPHVLLSGGILVAGAVFGYLASWYDPTLARELLLPTGMDYIQPGQESRMATTGELAGFSSFLFTHNTRVCLFACALGLTWGVGTALLMWGTGVMMGTLGAVFVEAGELRAFLTGIAPHGVLEIPAAVIGGAAGFVLAEAMVRARPWPRVEELARAGKRALWLVGGCFPLMFVAAFLEAGVARAPDSFLDSGLKLAVASVFGLLFLAYVLLFGRGQAGAELAALADPPG